MRKAVGLILVLVVGISFWVVLKNVPFGHDKIGVGNHYIENAIQETGATNIVTSVVVSYRGLDTLGEVTVLFIAALGLGLVLFSVKKAPVKEKESSSMIVQTGTRILFPFIMLFGIYVFVHGHLTPGGGFQGGAVIASGFLLAYLAWPARETRRERFGAVESLGGLAFVTVGVLGLVYAGYFLGNFLPTGVQNHLFSAGIIPVIYVAIGIKVGSELAGIVADMIQKE
jgi:multicomponent Na+:H+ antiporter subunit B